MTRSSPQSKGPLVLVVEDTPDSRRHLSIVLQDGGIAFTLAANENEALDILLRLGSAGEIEVIVADIDLSEDGGDIRGGILLAERLAQKQVRIPIVLISIDPWIYLPAKGSRAFQELVDRLCVHSVLDRNSNCFNKELIRCLRGITRKTKGKR